MLFTPYRAMGVVAEGPAILQQRGTESFVTVSIGKSFLIYDVAKLHVVVMGPLLPKRIRALAAYGDKTLCACGHDIVVCEYGKVVRELRGHTGPVQALLVMGSKLISAAEDGHLFVWDLESMQRASDLELPAGAHPTALAHPDAHLNKILVGLHNGGLLLMNIRTGKLVYRFADLPAAITAIEQSPAVDLVGVGAADGTLLLLDIRQDKTLARFQQSGAVTSLAFRSDGPAVAVTAAPDARVHLWDVRERVLLGSHPAAPHVLAVRSQPLLIAAGNNSLSVLRCEPHGVRVLRSRAGPVQPPACAVFASRVGVLCGAPDGLFGLDTAADRHTHRLSDAPAREQRTGRPLPPVTTVVTSQARERDWSNIVTAHAGEADVVIWRSRNKTSERILHAPRSQTPSPATAVAISTDGHFAFVGRADGSTDVYNMQSAQYRGRLAAQHAAGTAVTFIGQLANGSALITAGVDGAVHVVDWPARTLRHVVPMESGVARAALDPETGLLACAGDDFMLRVLDVQTQAVVRRFGPHGARITALAFSPDGRWLISGALDGTIRVWDMPSARLLDWWRGTAPPVALAMSPDGALLLSAHAGERGLYLWSNRTQYDAVVPRAPPAEPPLRLLPSVAGARDEDPQTAETDAAAAAEAEAEAEAAQQQRKRQREEEGLLELAGLPRPRWTALVDLETIRQRSKPVEPPAAPKAAPFFLPLQTGLQPKFVLPTAESEAAAAAARAQASRIVHHLGDTPLVAAARAAAASGQYDAVVDLLMSLSASAIDFEVRGARGSDSLRALLALCAALFRRGNAFELAEALLRLLLAAHGEAIAADAALVALATDVAAVHERAWQRAAGLFDHALCLLQFFAGAK